MKKKKVRKLFRKVLKQSTTAEKQISKVSVWIQDFIGRSSPDIMTRADTEVSTHCDCLCDSCRQSLNRRWSKQSGFSICSPESVDSVPDLNEPKDLNVSATARSTSTRKPPTEQCTIRKEKSTITTQERSTLTALETLISSLEDFRANPFLSPDTDWVSMTSEVISSLKLQDSLKPSDLRFFCLKMFPDCYRITRGKLSKSSLPNFPNWGIHLNGWCLTARISESRSSGEGCSLSDILEANVPEEYFLSNKAMERILTA